MSGHPLVGMVLLYPIFHNSARGSVILLTRFFKKSTEILKFHPFPAQNRFLRGRLTPEFAQKVRECSCRFSARHARRWRLRRPAGLSFVSQNYGAGEQKRIHRIVLLGEACVIVTGTLLGNAVVFFGNELLHIYSSNPEVIAAGIVRLHYISMVYALCGIMDVMVGALRGIGYSVMPMIVSIVGVCVLRLVWLATVFQIPEYHRIETVYLSYPVTWILTSLVYIVFFIWVRVRTCRKSAAA